MATFAVQCSVPAVASSSAPRFTSKPVPGHGLVRVCTSRGCGVGADPGGLPLERGARYGNPGPFVCVAFLPATPCCAGLVAREDPRAPWPGARPASFVVRHWRPMQAPCHGARWQGPGPWCAEFHAIGEHRARPDHRRMRQGLRRCARPADFTAPRIARTEYARTQVR
jgi:hypothetical protein